MPIPATTPPRLHADLLVPRVGSDLVSVVDVEGSIRAFGDRYLERIYTPLELEQSSRSPERLAGRFAGKEAVTKLLRPEHGVALPYRDIEIVSAASGAPHVRLHGRAALLRRARGLSRIDLSISHDRGFALATAVALLHRKESGTMKDTIRTVLDQHGHLSKPASAVADSDDLYQAGLTSHATVNVMLALEDELDLEFPDELLNRATFTSIEALAAAASSLQEA